VKASEQGVEPSTGWRAIYNKETHESDKPQVLRASDLTPPKKKNHAKTDLLKLVMRSRPSWDNSKIKPKTAFDRMSSTP